MYEEDNLLGKQKKFSFSFVAKRNASTLVVAMIIPGLFITLLGICYYLIPLGTDQRVNYLIVIILTEVMFLVMLVAFLPFSTRLPKVSNLFLFFTVYLVVITIMVSLFEI